jgi:hypothetical protein
VAVDVLCQTMKDEVGSLKKRRRIVGREESVVYEN